MELVDIFGVALLVIVSTLAVAGFGIILGLIYKGIDRKLSARMQGRIGPPIRQPFRDIVKLFTKENIIPENSIPWIFNMAPFIGLVSTISILLFIPIGGFEPVLGGLLTDGSGNPLIYGDLILILYLLLIPSLAMVIGGFASGSPYSTVGAQREMATMISYEFPLAIIIVGFAWAINRNITNLNSTIPDPSDYLSKNAFSITELTKIPTSVTAEGVINGTSTIWGIVGIVGIIGLLILLFVLILVTPAELSKIPFDSPEAETEIAGGLLAEYSGRNLGLFYLTDGVKTIVMASIIVTLFFPWNLVSAGLSEELANIALIQTGTGFPIYLGIIINILFFLFKILVVILFSVSVIRVAIARLKIDQIVYTYWFWLTLAALFGLVFILLDQSQILPDWLYF